MVAGISHEKLDIHRRPPQDFWNRAVVAFCVTTALSHDFTRLKISGIAPWSPVANNPAQCADTPPQDFWNRAVVARKGYIYYKNPADLPPQDFWNRAVVARSVKIRVIGVHFRLKISGIAPWSPLRGGTEGRERAAASRFLESRRGRPP